MSIRHLIVILFLLGVFSLGWMLLDDSSPTFVIDEWGDSPPKNATPEQPPAQSSPELAPAPAAPDSAKADFGAPIDVAARERFNEQAREFFARAPALSEEERLREAQRLEQELSRLEQAGGMSAGETFLLRVGLIRETVADEAQQAAQIKALQERYDSETRRRVAEASARPDPQFESYKARESEIVAEVMAMETIPDGLTRNEYLRRRLQAAREQITTP